MKQNRNRIVHTMTGLGTVLLALLLRLNLVAVDEKNLLRSAHPLSWAVWAVAAVCVVLALLTARKTREGKTLSLSDPICAFGHGIFALMLVIGVYAMGPAVSVVEKLCMVMGWLSAVCLGYGAFCHATGKRVFFGCYCVVCVFFALYLVGRYQVWSSNPQLLDYVFAMLSCVMLTLFAYQNAALCVGIGSRRMWLATGLLAVSFGFAAIYSWNHMLLHLGGAVWAMTTLLGRASGKR